MPAEGAFYSFVPSLDCIESGKFAFKEDSYNLRPLTDLAKWPIIQMSASSIGQACGLSRARVLDILKEIFVRLVEMAKRSDDIKLDFKVGYVNISAANELFFENYDPAEAIGRERIERENKNQEARQLDGGRISAALSTHSSFFVSVRTPGTAIRGSSGSSRRWDTWSNACGMTHGDQAAANARNRAKQDAKSVTAAIDRLSNSHVEAIPERKDEGKEEMPYPYLASFIEKTGQNRFGKKMNVANEHLSNKDFMGH